MVRKTDAVFGFVELGTEVLLVANKRRRGRIKWSLPGGSVGRGESPLQALTREVREETGVEVLNWSRLVYTSIIKYRGAGNDRDLVVEVHQAGGWQERSRATDDGDPAPDPEDLLRFGDVEGLGVVAGFFSDLSPVGSLVQSLRQYVREPILDWRSLPWEGPRHYEYRVVSHGPHRTVERLVPPE